MTRPGEDDGSVLLLVMGLAVVLFALVAVVVDVSAVVLAKRSLSSSADGAAIAAAQQIDPVAAAAGLGERIPLDPGLVADAVATYQADELPGQPGLQLTASLAGPDTAIVDATRTVRLPFTAFLGVGATVVHAQSRARSPVLP